MAYPALKPQSCIISRTPHLWGYGLFVVGAEEGRCAPPPPLDMVQNSFTVWRRRDEARMR